MIGNENKIDLTGCYAVSEHGIECKDREFIAAIKRSYAKLLRDSSHWSNGNNYMFRECREKDNLSSHKPIQTGSWLPVSLHLLLLWYQAS